MALLLSARSPMLRGALVSKRLIHFSPVQATAGDGETARTPVVGKSVLAQRLCETHKELSVKQAAEIIDTLCDDIMLTVAEGETVTLPGFGSFKKRHRAARKGRNPSTGAELDIPAKDAPNFSAGTVFKGVVQTGSWEAYDQLVLANKEAKKKK